MLNDLDRSARAITRLSALQNRCSTAELISALVAVIVDWSGGPQPQAPKPAVSLRDQTSVRLVGAPFIPNTNPRDRH